MEKWTIVLLGATGDLSRRKLIPALYNGIKKGSTAASHFILVGAAYEDVTVQQMIGQACPFIDNCDDTIVEHLQEQSSYCQVDFNQTSDFKKLQQQIIAAEHEHGCVGKRLIYCSIAPDFFAPVTQQLVDVGIIEKDNLDHRIVYEKPFGHDLASAQKMNKIITRLLHHDQVYRIDHYLTKELVNNIVVLRFTNSLLEKVWDNETVERVEIVINEEVGIRGRKFYEQYGALKDVVQNHLLQLFALTAMERPASVKFEHMASKKAELLQKVRVTNAVLGQYKGYTSESDVAPDSKTDTFATLKVVVDIPRWQGVPFYLQTGKCLERKQTEIRIIFKPVGECFLDDPRACSTNMFTIRVQPDEGIALQINAREPQDCRDELCRASYFGLMPVKLDFCHVCEFGPYAPQAYEILLQSIIAGDTEIGVSAQEIEAQWAIVEQVEKMNLKVYPYAQGSAGPKEMETL